MADARKIWKANRLSGVSLVVELPSPQLDYNGVVLVDDNLGHGLDILWC